MFGWRNVFAFAAIPLLLVWLAFFFLAKEPTAQGPVKKWKDYAAVLRIPDSAWFCFLYALTFGGFSGFTSYLSIFFRDQYAVTRVTAGDLTTFVILFGSFLRPVGGVLADKFGGYRMLLAFFTVAVVSLGLIATLPAKSAAVMLFALLMAMLGMGNGAVLQLVPQRFPEHIGIVTGVVGAAGGVGGFMLPSMMGLLKDRTGTFAAGFVLVAVLFTCGLSALFYLKNIWRHTWPATAAERAGLLPVNPVAASAYAAD
jgi:NNP family nitrate/nitrite transporter-like MFS transporter